MNSPIASLLYLYGDLRAYNEIGYNEKIAYNVIVRSHWAECFPFAFRIRKCCAFLKLSECSPNKIFLQCNTECFPLASRMISVGCQNRPNTSRMLLKCFFSKRFPYAFPMLSEYGKLNKNITELMFRDVVLSIVFHRL